MDNNSIIFKSKFGYILAKEHNNKIYTIKFTHKRKNNSSKILINLKKQIMKFFEKKTKRIIAPYNIEGNAIQKNVWNEISKIKYGKTKTYGEIAKKFKLSPRHVGKICGQNKLLLMIPCHRVVCSNGSMGGYSGKGGIKLKKKLLEFERS
tara:strand:- start:1015 stop:1464 length:450 start_codon:yes stop_codon:yes gene_type:complete